MGNRFDRPLAAGVLILLSVLFAFASYGNGPGGPNLASPSRAAVRERMEEMKRLGLMRPDARIDDAQIMGEARH